MDVALPPLKSPTDVLAVVPYLLGFTPERSVVVMGMRERHVVFQARCDLPAAEDVAAVTEHLAAVVGRQAVDAALLVAYGPGAESARTVDALRQAIESRGIDVLDALRADEGRYWSYLCSRPECCPPAGTPYDPSATVVAASATYAGLSPAASRADLVTRLAPADGVTRIAMRAASRRAEQRLGDLVGAAAEAARDVVLPAGIAAVDAANARIGSIAPLDDDAVAWLALLLLSVPVRDYAWERVGHDVDGSVALWSDVVRRVDPELAAGPATLLAYAAWRRGDGAIASIALDRAMDADPTYSLARLLAEAIDHGIPPGPWLDVPVATEGVDRAAAVRQHRKRRRRARPQRQVRVVPPAG
ncbi:MAG TPA: DUF4192 domain-containing protein [Micromonosporaceae bacterium]|jgi:hypothetical protein|nr:DUF4192 domain-containing protein [Micromonosporaceae bacterium]